MKKLLCSLALLIIIIPGLSLARNPWEITEWYVEKLSTTIRVNVDSTAIITEKIVADCGNLPDKHGIFRTLPTEYKTDYGQVIKTPIELVSITDDFANDYDYQVIKGSGTVTYKIGSADRTVTGQNTYVITYKVKNVMQFKEDTDRFYWNLTGNDWDMEIDSFSAMVTFPKEFNQNIKVYDGWQGSKGSEMTKFSTLDQNVLVNSNKMIKKGQGVTLVVDFPKGSFAPYVPGFWEIYGPYLPYLLVIFCIFFSLIMVFLFGRDPKVKKTVVVEFGPPNKLDPMLLGNLEKKFSSNTTAALLIDLAVRGYLKIEEAGRTIAGKDYQITLLKDDFSALKDHEKALILAFLGKSPSTNVKNIENLKIGASEKVSKKRDQISDLLDEADTLADKYLSNHGYVQKMDKPTKTAQVIMIIFALLLLAPLIYGIVSGQYLLMFSAIVSLIIVVVAIDFLEKLSPHGAEINYKIKGFKLYMETAEKYRQQFNEKENIFERFLPYAILFGITKEWINQMKKLYGQEYVDRYHPVWFVGNYATFNADSFSSSISEVSSSVRSSSMSGGGGSGGGGGGGGGGGW